MLDVTPQERLALTVLATLIAAGAIARHSVHRADAEQWLEYSANAADTLNPASSSVLRSQAEAELALDRVRNEPLSAGERIDPNTAPAEQLDRLPRVGPALAERIVAHRESQGAFRTTADLGAVSGIGPALLEGIGPYLDLRAVPAGPARARSAASLVDINRATAEELQTLPGVGPVIAVRIVEYRREHGRFATFEDLEEVAGIGAKLRERIEAAARLGS
jgi:competence ComEA-like helix-hairpin-helix protein